MSVCGVPVGLSGRPTGRRSVESIVGFEDGLESFETLDPTIARSGRAGVGARSIPSMLVTTRCSRPCFLLVTSPAFSRTDTCFCTAAKLNGCRRARADTEWSPVIAWLRMSRLVRSASAWNRAVDVLVVETDDAFAIYNHLVVD